MGRATYRQMSGPEGYLAHLTPFEGHSLRGVVPDNYSSYWSGRLSSAEADKFRADINSGLVRYIVVSYSTPIAWVLTTGEVHCVEEKFSVTTSKQQGYVGAWLGAAIEGTDTHKRHIERGYRRSFEVTGRNESFLIPTS